MVAIVALAVYLRLTNLDLAEFKRDEATLALMAGDLVAGRSLPLAGLDSSQPGLANGPLMVYLIALPLLLARDALLATGFVALLNVLAIVVTARVAERFFGRVTALLAAATYAVGSWAVVFSRKIWPQDAMPIFSALLALGLHDAIISGRERGLVLVGIALGCLVNLHPSGVAFVPLVFVAFALRPAALRARAALIGAAAFVLISAPFMIHEVQRGLPALRVLRASTGSTARFDPSALGGTLALVGPNGFVDLTGAEADQFLARALPAGPLADVSAALLIGGTALAVLQLARRLGRGPGWRMPALALLWLVVPVLASTWRSFPLGVNHLPSFLPAAHVFLGLALAAPIRLTRGGSPTVRALAQVVPALFVIWAGIIQTQHLAALRATVREIGGRLPYGVPLLHQRTAAERATALARERPIALVSQPGPDGGDDLPAVWRFLLPPEQELRLERGDGLLRLTPTGTLYVVAPSADGEALDFLTARGTLAGRPVQLPGLERGYQLFRAGARPPAAGAGLGVLENGLRLESVQHPAAINGEVLVRASWRVEADPPDEEVTLFVHLVDDRGQGIVGRDLSGIGTGPLEAGDELASWARLVPPSGLGPGRYWLYLGAYRTRDVRRFRVEGSSESAIRVGPLKVAAPTGPSTATPLARFDQGITLESARLPLSPVAVSIAPIELIWSTERRPERDLTVFVHLVDAAGNVVAQHDGQPADRTYPTSIWDPGERIVDIHRPALPAGRYRVLVGLYDPTDLRRVRRVDGGDSVEVGTLEAG